MDFDDTSLGSVIVIGGCGLLGHHVVNRLLEAPDVTTVTVFDITTNRNRYDGVTYITGDISNKANLLAAFQKAKPTVIINSASPDAPSTTDKTLFFKVNVVGVQNVLDCAHQCSIKILVHTSSTEVVQRSYDDMINMDESAPVLDEPVDGSLYAKSKVIGEKLTLEANRTNGLLTTAIRLCTLVGEGDIVLTKHMLELAQSGRVKFQVGSGENLYDFIYAGNAADGHITAARALIKTSTSPTPIPEAQRVDGEAFFMSNEEPWPFWDMARFVANNSGHPIRKQDVWVFPLGLVMFFAQLYGWVYWALSLGGQPRVTASMLRYTGQTRTFNNAKARQRLGYKARVGLEEGVRRGIKWNLSQEKRG